VIDNSNYPVELNYFLKPGYIFLPTKPTLISTVLGSCVAVCLYDRKRKVGGMNHFQFPAIAERKEATAIYGNVATRALVLMMMREGSKAKHLQAQIFGGAHDPRLTLKNVGHENIRVARKILGQAHIRIVSEDVGGEMGRKIIFNTATNEIAIIKVDRLRKADWFPYDHE
jgi:chemotaxis protein CheD